VDPGSRIPVVCYEKAGGQDSYTKYSAKRFFFETREFCRRQYLKRKNETLEREYRVDVERKQPNFKDGRKYRETVAFLNNWFDRRWKVYVEDNRLVRDQTLDRYLCKQKACQNVVETMFPKNRGKTLILYGKGCEFMNRSNYHLKGCAKFSHNSLLAKLTMERYIIVKMADESYTTKLCSTCKEDANEDCLMRLPNSQNARHHRKA